MAKLKRHPFNSKSPVVWSTCTIATVTGEFCDATVPEGAPVSACGKHLVAAYRYCEELLDLAVGNSDLESKSDRFERFHRWNTRRTEIEQNSVVYYAVVGRYIKIGTTCRIKQRMNGIKADELLATEPGGRELEVKRHNQFAHIRADVPRHVELFHPGPDLVTHINEFRAGAGVPLFVV